MHIPAAIEQAAVGHEVLPRADKQIIYPLEGADMLHPDEVIQLGDGALDRIPQNRDQTRVWECGMYVFVDRRQMP
jgi:hypothetical protein